MREIIREELENVPKAETSETLLGLFQPYFSRIQSAIGNIRFPELDILKVEPVNLNPMRDAIVGLRRVIERIPAPERVDLEPIISAFGEMRNAIVLELSMLRAAMPKLSAEQREAMEGKLKSLEEAISKTPFQVLLHTPSEQKPKRRLLLT